jgi:hypothetical protein
MLAVTPRFGVAANHRGEALMNYRKRGLKALGVSLLAALGLMGFIATEVQAAGTVTIAGLSSPFETPISMVLENTLNSRYWILKLNLEISCHKGSGTGALTSSGHGKVTIRLEECLAQGVTSGGVLTGSPCTMERNIEAKVLALVLLHGTENKPYILFSPAENETFALILEYTCPLPEHALIKGAFVASIANPAQAVGSKLISTKGTLTLFTGDKMFYGANEAHLDLDAVVGLSGENHIGLAWAIS